MLEMLMKQLLGNVDMDSVKKQFSEFAQMVAEIHANSVATRDAVLRLERLAKSQTAEEATLTHDKEMRNGNDSNDTNGTGNDGSGPHGDTGSGGGANIG